MPPLLCQNCLIEMIRDARDPDKWVCPRCNNGIISRVVQDYASAAEGVGLHGKSDQMVRGAPEREFSRTLNVDGDWAAVEVERSLSEDSIQRSVGHRIPYNRDRNEQKKRQEDERAVAAMLTAYNREHGTDYRVKALTEDEAELNDSRGIDVVAISQSGASPELCFQVTKADSTPWRALARSASHSEYLSETALMNRFWNAILEKQKQSDPNIILVLDGWGLTPPVGTVDRFAEEFGDRLKTIRFREVWWADRSSGGVVRRLAPQPSGCSLFAKRYERAAEMVLADGSSMAGPLAKGG
jgi:hypothetical protein